VPGPEAWHKPSFLYFYGEGKTMILMIDNYDSFVYNLYQYLLELGEEVRVYRNDKITLEEIEALQPRRIILSPGPCTPNEAGICLDLIKSGT